MQNTCYNPLLSLVGVVSWLKIVIAFDSWQLIGCIPISLIALYNARCRYSFVLSWWVGFSYGSILYFHIIRSFFPIIEFPALLIVWFYNIFGSIYIKKTKNYLSSFPKCCNIRGNLNSHDKLRITRSNGIDLKA